MRTSLPFVLVDFFLHLKTAKLPVSTREFLTLLEALSENLAYASMEEFYYLARTCLVKDEALYDRFDLVFGTYFKGIATLFEIDVAVPEEWLKKLLEKNLTDEEKRLIEALGGWDKLIETFRRRLQEQKERHEGGSKWIGTGGTSPYGAYGFNPEGIRLGQEGGRGRSAVKVWDRRDFRNLDGNVEIGTRNIKVALRRLRRFAREGAPEELDLEGTVAGTAKNGGWLDLHLVPEKRNHVKVLLFLDVGGSMDPHVRMCEELFSAARAEFKHLEHFYFHNCVYDYVWRDNRRRSNERIATWDILHKYGTDYKVIMVGDAAMSPYELVQEGGSVEYMNAETGLAWLKRLFDTYPKTVWLNPEPERTWQYTRSTQMILNVLGDRMFPLTLDGLERGIRELKG